MLREVEGGWALELGVAMVTTDDDDAVVTVLLVSACLSPGLRLSMSQITHRINIRKSVEIKTKKGHALTCATFSDSCVNAFS